MNCAKKRRKRRALVARDGYRCAYCGIADAELTIDHVIPKSRNGVDALWNLRLSCLPCNTGKGSKYVVPADWEKRRMRTTPETSDKGTTVTP